jgi:O-antigen ligase
MNSDLRDTKRSQSQKTVDKSRSSAGWLNWDALSDFLGRLSNVLFIVLVILMLTTPSWRAGTFSWQPIKRFADLGGPSASVGIFSLFPFIFIISWAIHRLATWRAGRPQSWSFGRVGVKVPLLLLTLIGLASLISVSGRIIFIQIGGLIVFWGTYFYLLNERPRIVPALAIVLLVQGSVALAQFLEQGDLNLLVLGELPLDSEELGTSVIFARGQRWLRSYGLTAHPNLLGAMFTAILLLLLPALKRSIGRERLLLAIAYTAGLIGLLVSFSRAATLAYIVGLVTWLILDGKAEGGNWSMGRLKKSARSPFFIVAALIFIVVLVVFGDLVLSRVTNLDSEIEATSINQRFSDWRLALTIISQNPIVGTGLGQYVFAAKNINPFAINVHSIPLLVTAELGIGGLLLYLWLAVSGLRSRVDALAPWIAVLIIGLFDLTLWLTGNWQTSIIFAFIVANLSQDILTNKG